jgi:hypothetical protein
MAWIHFIECYDWKPRPSVTIAYKSGMTANVTRACADAAVKAGKAERMTRKNKDQPWQPVNSEN